MKQNLSPEKKVWKCVNWRTIDIHRAAMGLLGGVDYHWKRILKCIHPRILSGFTIFQCTVLHVTLKLHCLNKYWKFALFLLVHSCHLLLTTYNLPRFTDLTLHIPMQYCFMQYCSLTLDFASITLTLSSYHLGHGASPHGCCSELTATAPTLAIGYPLTAAPVLGSHCSEN